jgi:hypothetical protein
VCLLLELCLLNDDIIGSAKVRVIGIYQYTSDSKDQTGDLTLYGP